MSIHLVGGGGPGEFRSIAGMQIGPNDSLYVYDRNARRLTVLATQPNSTNPRTFTLPPGPKRLHPYNVGSFVSGIEGMWLTATGRPLIVYGRYLNPKREISGDRHLQIRFIDGSSMSSLFVRTQPKQMLALRGAGGASLYPMPFGMKPVIEMGPDNHLYFGYSDSLIIRKKPVRGGRARKVVSSKFSPVELSDDLLQSRLKMKGQEDLLENISIVQEKTPSHVPVFEDFAVDGNGRVWVAVNTSRALKGGRTEYWVFDPNGKLIHKILFDRLIFLKTFTKTDAYGLATKPSGAQQIVRASLDTLLP